jgi:hypothetical protein
MKETMMSEKQINPILKQVLELGPTLVFFLIYLRIKDDVGLNGYSLAVDWKTESHAGFHRIYGHLFWWADGLV